MACDLTKLPEDLPQLSNLTELDVSYNDFVGNALPPHPFIKFKLSKNI